MRRQPAILGLAALLVGLLVTPSSANVQPRGGTWSGKTAQGLPIEFVVKKKPNGWKVVRVEYQVTSTCTGGFAGQTPITFPVTTRREFPISNPDGTVESDYKQRKDSWTFGLFGGGDLPSGGSVTQLNAIVGRFLDKRKAKGFLKSESESHIPGVEDSVCRSGNVRWTARR